jgi:hypothetical protein
MEEVNLDHPEEPYIVENRRVPREGFLNKYTKKQIILFADYIILLSVFVALLVGTVRLSIMNVNTDNHDKAKGKIKVKMTSYTQTPSDCFISVPYLPPRVVPCILVNVSLFDVESKQYIVNKNCTVTHEKTSELLYCEEFFTQLNTYINNSITLYYGNNEFYYYNIEPSWLIPVSIIVYVALGMSVFSVVLRVRMLSKEDVICLICFK